MTDIATENLIDKLFGRNKSFTYNSFLVWKQIVDFCEIQSTHTALNLPKSLDSDAWLRFEKLLVKDQNESQTKMKQFELAFEPEDSKEQSLKNSGWSEARYDQAVLYFKDTYKKGLVKFKDYDKRAVAVLKDIKSQSVDAKTRMLIQKNISRADDVFHTQTDSFINVRNVLVSVHTKFFPSRLSPVKTVVVPKDAL